MTQAKGRTRSQLLGLAVAVLLASGMAVVGYALVAGQTAQSAPPHPAHIHEGTCGPELNPNPIAPLDDVAGRKLDDDRTPTSEDFRGSLNAAEVEISESEGEISFDTVLESPHAINVHESAENIGNYIACGDIGGLVADDKLFIGLSELNDSGYSGVAILEAADDDKTKVTIYLSRPTAAAGATPGTPTP